MLLSVDGTKSGKPSWLGDSGMFSRKGVEPPLVGGPHGFGVKPSCAWISLALRKARVRLHELRYRLQAPSITYRFEYNRPPSSCEGEPAPNRALFDESPEFTSPFVFPNGDFITLPGGGSTGELAPVEGPDWGLW